MQLTDEEAGRLYAQYLAENFRVDRDGCPFWTRPGCVTFKVWLAQREQDGES